MKETVTDDESGHRLRRLHRQVEVGGDGQSRPTFNHQLLDAIAVAVDDAGAVRFALTGGGKIAQGSAQGGEANVAEAFPFGEGLYLVPFLRKPAMSVMHPAVDVLRQHL